MAQELLVCPCGSQRSYAACCGALIEHRRAPAGAEELMRSRFSAFALGIEPWLRETWAPETQPQDAILDEGLKWFDLRIKASRTIDETHARVEFVARARSQSGASRLHEDSLFEKRDGKWYYVDGKQFEK